MRTPILALLALAFSTASALSQPIAMSPELQKFMTAPEEERTVKGHAQKDWQSIFPDCTTPHLASANVVVLSAPKFDGTGRPTSGDWQVVSKVEGCGHTRLFNLRYAVGSNGQVARVPGLPGNSIADPVLQRDSLMYASMAMAKLAPPDCKDYRYTDTAFEAFGTGQSGAKSRPWTEKWTVRACGIDGLVRLHFTPDATGTQITAKTEETTRLP